MTLGYAVISVPVAKSFARFLESMAFAGLPVADGVYLQARMEENAEIMQWITDNWVLLLFGGGMIAMHLFGHGHGGHGGHGGCGKHKAKQTPKPDDAGEPSPDEDR